ncbi:hypothetical protein M902_0388 [Bacteriovorax sp. BAL6_X]|uniref:hypothetical protein n=1 Tax=Bacteriovorax sp. BAL6_X TaxID=1201290 RepID=UPI0003857F70|nr:hypothetical protein [Bacteriovorax sp. BAL6_X]EPZ49740.1 hypothetical protein M902_0388 [Bacteriovorax sp. BAL6_X]
MNPEKNVDYLATAKSWQASKGAILISDPTLINEIIKLFNEICGFDFEPSEIAFLHRGKSGVSSATYENVARFNIGGGEELFGIAAEQLSLHRTIYSTHNDCLQREAFEMPLCMKLCDKDELCYFKLVLIFECSSNDWVNDRSLIGSVGISFHEDTKGNEVYYEK